MKQKDLIVRVDVDYSPTSASDASTTPMAGGTPDTFTWADLLAADRKLIAQTRKDAQELANDELQEPHALQLLGFTGDSPDELWSHVRYCADHGNTMAVELLRQDEAAKMGERP